VRHSRQIPFRRRGPSFPEEAFFFDQEERTILLSQAESVPWVIRSFPTRDSSLRRLSSKPEIAALRFERGQAVPIGPSFAETSLSRLFIFDDTPPAPFSRARR